jgi:hypothetical protein
MPGQPGDKMLKNPFEPPSLFPYEEFTGLVYRVLEVLESDPRNDGGLKVLAAVRGRVLETGNSDLLELVDRRLGTSVLSANQSPNPKTLRQLVSFISHSTDPGSVFVLRRTDRLGDREKQEELIRSSPLSICKLWFAPERFGQRSPAMAFVQLTEEIHEGTLEIAGISLSVSKFIYDR